MDAVALPLQLPAHIHVRRHHAALRLLIILPIVLAGVLAVGFIKPTAHVQSLTAEGKQPLAAELAVGFSWPVSRELQVQIAPHIEGQVTYRDALVRNRLVRTVAFIPDRTWQPDTTYTIVLTHVQNATHLSTKQYDAELTFTTESLPAIVGVLPDPAEAIAPDTAWTVTFDQPRSPQATITGRLEPFIELAQTWSADGKTLTVRPAQFLVQGTQYTLHLLRTPQQYAFGTADVAVEGEPQELLASSWSVRAAPGTPTITPAGTGVAVDTPITIRFAEAVDAAAFTAQVQLLPAVAGTWTSTDRQTFTLQPDVLQTATTYTVTIQHGLRTVSGGILDTDVRGQFRTVEPIALATSAPTAGAKGVLVNHKIRLTFNQPVQHEGISTKVSIAPALQGQWSWVKDELIFTPQRTFAFGTTYTVTVAKTLQPVQGLPAPENLALTFTTEQATTRLAVPFHRQEHNLSCEIATLVMALRYRGVDIGEQKIIDAIGFDRTPKKNGVWGDPDVAFVGNIDGQQPGTGYGVNAAPIAKAGSAYRTTRAFKNGNLTEVLNEVKAGNPVIVWGNAASGRRVDWKTPTGKTVLAIVGEHTRVVIGFTGSVSNPATIITLDPLYGEKRFSKNAFLADWALLGNMGVVVE